jgi:hypothetical protein
MIAYWYHLMRLYKHNHFFSELKIDPKLYYYQLNGKKIFHLLKILKLNLNDE